MFFPKINHRQSKKNKFLFLKDGVALIQLYDWHAAVNGPSSWLKLVQSVRTQFAMTSEVLKSYPMLGY